MEQTTIDIQEKPTVPGRGGPKLVMFLFLMLGLVLMFVLMSGSQRKEKRKRKEMLSSLKKGDKVQTIGGILGSVVEVKDTHVVVKVDENSNTRLKFSRSAVQTVVDRPDKESGKSEKQEKLDIQDSQK